MKAYHNSWDLEYRVPFGAAKVGSDISIAIDILDANKATVHLCLSFEGKETFYKMKKTSTNENASRFSYKFKSPKSTGLLWYSFKIETEDGLKYYGNNNENTGGMGALYDCEPNKFQITIYNDFENPVWYKNGIVYQIFPDRFNRDEGWEERADNAIRKRNSRIIDEEKSQAQYIERDWNQSAYYSKDEEGNVIDWQFFGGSLRGIAEKLYYLKSLGVSAIYLNPIFEAVSNHRYDTANYFKIDPILGSEDDFKYLASESKKLDIKLILDGVFSHTGADSIYFDKYGNYGGKGAYSDEKSPYRNWYSFDNSECGYKSWWGIRDLPEVNENESSYKNMICSKDGVLNKWLKLGASGWRLDVADELPDNFIKEIRKTVKSNDTDNLLIGEVWEDASNKISYNENRKYLMGDELDSVMNYPLRQILLDYVNYTISSNFAGRKIMSLIENYPKEALYGALNILGTHDRERILTMMAAEQDYNAACSKVKLLSTLQYTLPGVPCIYYGDEIAMTGGSDPSNRNTMAWEQANMDMHYHYRMLGLIYDEHPVLKDGKINFLFENTAEDVIAFTRENEQEKILVLANRSYGNTEIDLSDISSLGCGYALELLQSKEVKLGKMNLEPLSSKIILLLDKRPVETEKTRRAGVICHISSLPEGNMGQSARNFVDWMHDNGLKIWQILPLNPNGLGNCPYNTNFAFAGNPDFICRDELPDKKGYKDFCKRNKFWLDDYHYSKEEILEQYYFDVQWHRLKDYANSKGIEIMGDLPIYVSADSADVKANPEIFLLNEDNTLSVNAGVPPDDFTTDGQNWGLALYDWKALKNSNYDWWKKRILQCADRYDILRIDHFRGFSEYFAIPAGKDGKFGNWQHGPGLELFNELQKTLDENKCKLEILAEDLGILDAGVLNLIKLTGFNGMDIWQFSADKMLSIPDTEAKKRAFYTGTHDNHTLIGWLREKHPDYTSEELIEESKRIIEQILNTSSSMVILQLQDIFMLDDSARMNIPGIAEGNWSWKISKKKFREDTKWLAELIKKYC